MAVYIHNDEIDFIGETILRVIKQEVSDRDLRDKIFKLMRKELLKIPQSIVDKRKVINE